MSKLMIMSLLLLISSCSQNEDEIVSSSLSTCLSNGYYVDATTGNNNNSGDNSCSPWKSIDKINSFSFSGATTIYLKRGEIWSEGLILHGNDISISAYGSGANPILSGAISAGPWTNEGSGIYSFVATIDAGEVLGNISKDNVLMALSNGILMPLLPLAPLLITLTPTITLLIQFISKLVMIHP